MTDKHLLERHDMHTYSKSNSVKMPKYSLSTQVDKCTLNSVKSELKMTLPAIAVETDSAF